MGIYILRGLGQGGKRRRDDSIRLSRADRTCQVCNCPSQRRCKHFEARGEPCGKTELCAGPLGGLMYIKPKEGANNWLTSTSQIYFHPHQVSAAVR